MENEEKKPEVVVEQKENVEFGNSKTIVIPEEYRPISMWGYFGYQLLFAIPCIGIIVLIVFALGGQRNINVRNFARSYFCWLIIGLILTLIVLVIAIALGSTYINSRIIYS